MQKYATFPATRLQKLHPGCSSYRKSTKRRRSSPTERRFIYARKAGCKLLPTHANERRGWDKQIFRRKHGKQMVAIEKLFLNALHDLAVGYEIPSVGITQIRCGRRSIFLSACPTGSRCYYPLCRFSFVRAYLKNALRKMCVTIFQTRFRVTQAFGKVNGM